MESQHDKKSGFVLNSETKMLRKYNRVKLHLAGQIRMIREVLTAMGRKSGEQQCGELIVKLAEDRFTLAVLGQFNRGKSSLMNSIIGRDLLPSGVLPVTSVLTIIKYGAEEQLIINYQYPVFPEELPVSSLPEFVTEEGNPGNIKKVKNVCVELPVPFFRRGIEFIDTPGIGSSDPANIATTYSFLSTCDAVVFVTSADSPITMLELEFLKGIQEYVNKIFLVVNKTDLISGDELVKVLPFIKKTVQEYTGSESLKLFPVSAHLGLSGKAHNDSMLLEKSGIIALEETLDIFLYEEKMHVFLASIVKKALSILEEENVVGTFEPNSSKTIISSAPDDQVLTIRRDLTSAVKTVKKATTKLTSLYEGIVNNKLTDGLDIFRSLVDSSSTTPLMETALQTLTPELGNITEDLLSGECPICLHITRKASAFFSQWQYRLGSEETAQVEFAEETGFCPVHTWQLIDILSPHGASVGLSCLTETVAHLLSSKNDSVEAADKVTYLVKNNGNCRVCWFLRLIERDYIRKMTSFIAQEEGLLHYSRSQGVCLHHLGMLLKNVKSQKCREFLLSHEALRFAEVAEDMRSFALKNEALRRDLQNRDEMNAFLRAVTRLVGCRSIGMPWA